jgi:hypothetical protein
MSALETFIVSLSITAIGFLLKYFFSRKPRLRYYYGAITDIPFPVTVNQSSQGLSANTPLSKDSPADSDSQLHTEETTNLTQDTPTVNYIRTHTVIISNQGNASAKNVRVGHYFLPAHAVSPPMNINNPDNVNEILVPILCPKEFFTISYLYPRPIIWSNINCYFKCDEGMAEFANMQDIRIKSPVLIWLINGVFFIGVFSIIYFGIKLLPYLYKLFLLATS